MQTTTISRHAPCFCGSGKKFKQCCGSLPTNSPRHPPNSVDALLANAKAAVTQGNLMQAEHYFEQVLALAPSQAEALAGLGQTLCWQQRIPEGLTYLKMAANELQQQAEQTGKVRPLIDLCTQFLHWGDLATAVEWAENLVKLAPNNPSALNNLALCYSRTNRDKEALPYAHSACYFLPDDPGCNILLAILAARQGQLIAAKKRLEHVLDVCKDDDQTARAYLELGIVLDKLGQFEQAFATFETASAKQLKLPSVQAVDPDIIFKVIADNRAGFNAALLQRWVGQNLPADGLPTPVFLFGFLRSGTTLTEQILAAHPEVLTSNEEPFIAELISELRRLTTTTESLPTVLARLSLENSLHLRQFYWQRVTAKYGEQAKTKLFIDKMALNSIEAGLISCLFPEAKILLALRDPRDVCLSCFMQAFIPSPATVNLLSWSGIAKQYSALMDYWLEIRDSLAPVVMEVRYEDTVNQFETTYRRIFDFLGLAWHPDCAAFHTQVAGRYIATPSFSAVSQPLYQSAAGRWRQYARHFTPILPQLERFIAAFGYAK